MPDMMAIVSKAIFEKEAPGAKPGDVLPLAVYRSTSKFLERLDARSRLFLVTVRPGDRLWLVAVLEGLSSDGTQWNARPNSRPVTELTPLQGSLRFESGKGLQAARGQLGMSLQTPRVLTPGDAALLLGAAGAAAPPVPARPAGAPNLAAHDTSGPLPCLCKTCLARAPERAEAGGVAFIRASVEARGRVLPFWLPAELGEELGPISQSVKSSLLARLKELPR